MLSNISPTYYAKLLIGSLKGIVKDISAPLPSLLFLAKISPLCASTILLQIDKPKPVPIIFSELSQIAEN